LVNLEIIGVKEAIKVLQDLKGSVTRNDFEKAAEIALMPVHAAAIANVRSVTRKKTGRLHRSIIMKKMGPRTRRRYGMFAGMYVGADYSVAPHAHLLEYGTYRRAKKSKRGAKMNTGRVTPKPFLRPAYHQNRGTIFVIAARELGKRVQKKIDRAIKKNQARI